MSVKVVLVGGGSYKWTPVLAKDLFLKEGLKGGELSLVDIDEEAAGLLKRYCETAAEAAGTGWKVGVSPLDEALEGADAVCVSISTGGLEAMDLDYHMPEKYGVYHCVGDTVGPGGIMRSLRNIPVFTDIGRRMEKKCPDAWMVHVTNPLSQLTRAVSRETSVKVAGLCHNFAGTIRHLALYLEAGDKEISADCVGVNHFTWLKNIACRGKPPEKQFSLKGYLSMESRRRSPVDTGTTDDDIEAALGGKPLNYYLNFELFERFGTFPVGTSSHVAENLPYYCNSPETLKKHHIRRKGVFPFRKNLHEEKKREVVETIEGKRSIGGLSSSSEGLADIVESLRTGSPSRVIAAMPNRGQVSNMPEDVIVETWVEADAEGLHPVMSGPVPEPLAGLMQIIVDEQETTVEAALKGSRELVVRAMALSPMVYDKDSAESMAEEMLAAQSGLLPRFE